MSEDNVKCTTDVCEERGTIIERERLFTSATLAQHLDAIGKAISADAKGMFQDIGNISKFNINVDVEPNVRLTVIEYRIQRNADPRIPDRKVDE